MLPQTLLFTPAGQIQGAGPAPLVGIPGVFFFSNGTVSQATPQVVPLQPVVSQTLSITLNQQACTIFLYAKLIQVPASAEVAVDPPTFLPINPMFLDLYTTDANNVTRLVIGGVLCQDRNRLVRNSYLGFSGDLAFVDSQGIADPLPSGLGSRWLLTYWSQLA
jgi:hypothetical protein